MNNEWLRINEGNLKGFTFSIVGKPENRIVMERHTGQLYRIDQTAQGLTRTKVSTSQYLLG